MRVDDAAVCVLAAVGFLLSSSASQISQIEPDQDVGTVLRWFGCSVYASQARTLLFSRGSSFFCHAERRSFPRRAPNGNGRRG